MLRPCVFSGVAFSLLLGCAAQPVDPPVAQVPPPEVPTPEVLVPDVPVPTIPTEDQPLTTPPTLVKDRAALARLISNSGLTLQWIGWEQRGQLRVFEDRGSYFVDGTQIDPNNEKASLSVNGRITEIGSDYFILDGEIAIRGTPDADRDCRVTKPWRFAITQNRKYWRLREFEWCDYLTDYVDIYF